WKLLRNFEVRCSRWPMPRFHVRHESVDRGGRRVLLPRCPRNLRSGRQRRIHKTRPSLIIEVTSPSTTVTDHREKLLAYRKIPSLREYVMITQHEMKVEIYRLDSRGYWWLETYGPEHSFKLESVDMEIAVKDLYEDVLLVPWPANLPEPPTNPV